MLLTAFGSLAVGGMLLSYWLESRSAWFVLAFSAGCVATAVYSVLVQAYPITAIEGLWGLVALDRFRKRRHLQGAPSSPIAQGGAKAL